MPLAAILLHSQIMLVTWFYLSLAISLGLLAASGALSSPKVLRKTALTFLVMLGVISASATVLPLIAVIIIGFFVALVGLALILTNVQYDILERLEEIIQKSAVDRARTESKNYE